MPAPQPILTAHLLPTIEALLAQLLQSLNPDEWERQTTAPKWKIKDVAAHLLDTQLRKLSIARDGYVPSTPEITSRADLAAMINRLNQEGVDLYRRLSPPVLISLLEVASRESAAYHQSLDPFGEARFAVSWAGEDRSLNWFDTARELTERWHHQQQIRSAVGRPGIMTPELYHPVLDCFMRALPFTYRDAPGEDGTVARFDISGECGGSWYLRRDQDHWDLTDAPIGTIVSRTIISQEIAWLIFTRGMDRATATPQVTVSGDQRLGLRILEMVSIVA